MCTLSSGKIPISIKRANCVAITSSHKWSQVIYYWPTSQERNYLDKINRNCESWSWVSGTPQRCKASHPQIVSIDCANFPRLLTQWQVQNNKAKILKTHITFISRRLPWCNKQSTRHIEAVKATPTKVQTIHNAEDYKSPPKYHSFLSTSHTSHWQVQNNKTKAHITLFYHKHRHSDLLLWRYTRTLVSTYCLQRYWKHILFV